MLAVEGVRADALFRVVVAQQGACEIAKRPSAVRPGRRVVRPTARMVASRPPAPGKADGVLLVNSSIVGRRPRRTDLEALMVPGDAVAQELGNPRVANLVLLGALLATLPVPALDQVQATLEHAIPAHRRNLLEMNREALRRGAALAREEAPAV